MKIHDHGRMTELHAHVQLEDTITCARCGWTGKVEQCVRQDRIFEAVYHCPGRYPYSPGTFPFWGFMKSCKAPLVVMGEEDGLHTLKNVKLPEIAQPL